MRDAETNSHEDGFTLVELLITIIVLGIAIAGIAGLYYTMQITQVRSQHLDLATRAARTEIEKLRNNGYSSLVPGTTVAFDPPAGLPQGGSGSVQISQPVDGLRRVDVTISYTDYGKAETVELSSNIGVIGIGEGQ
jgi:prepilin-type N-terminal cleavage/methylation domain-containing protein